MFQSLRIKLYSICDSLCMHKKIFTYGRNFENADVYMLWFKFILGLMFFELVSILFAIVPDYGNEYMTRENKN